MAALKRLSLLGSTGSIGTQTLDIVRANPRRYKIVALAAGRNLELLEKQAAEFKPQLVSVEEQRDALALQSRLAGRGLEKIKVVHGLEGLEAAASHKEADTVVNALVGAIGILPTLAAIKARKHVALANKETLVAAGQLVMDAVRKYRVHLTPIDSEHSALFQLVQGNHPRHIGKIIITCSGGPFRTWTKEQMEHATVEQALKHPTWAMGNWITIQSATLSNKGREVIEAMHLFGVKPEQVRVVVHPTSTIHGGVEFKDKSLVLQAGVPDMRVPIQYALSWPERHEAHAGVKSLDLVQQQKLEFEEPDLDRFPSLRMAYEAARIGGTLPAVYNAADEVAIRAFFEKKIRFPDIPRILERVLREHKLVEKPKLEDVLAADRWARERAHTVAHELRDRH